MRRILGRSAVPLAAALTLFLVAACGDSPVGPDVPEPLYDDGMACAESHNDGGDCAGGGPWPGEPDPPPGGREPDCPINDCGGGPGGGEGGGGYQPYPGYNLLGKLFEYQRADTLIKVPTSCPPTGIWTSSPGWEQIAYAWCNGKKLDEPQWRAIQTALDRMDELGSPCSLMAIQGRNFLLNGRFRVFDESAFPDGVEEPGGAGFKNGIALKDFWFGLLDMAIGAPGWLVNLQFALAHEIEHTMKGGGHLTLRGKPRYYEETENSRKCSGLPDTPRY